VQTLPIDKIIVVCGCIWAVAIIIIKKRRSSWKKAYGKKNYELVHFKMCEMNFELVHVEIELSQHCLWH